MNLYPTFTRCKQWNIIVTLTNLCMVEITATYLAGKYFVGEVCYALNHDVYYKQWGKLYQYASGTYVIAYKGIQSNITVAHTAYGEGNYVNNVNHLEFQVLGTIGIVPYNLCDRKKIKNNKIRGGHFIESYSPVNFKAKDGVYVIQYNDNHDMIVINTE